METKKIKILAFLNKEKEICQQKLSNYDGDVDSEMSYSRFVY